MQNRLKNSDGTLTEYGLACGYVERHEVDDANRIVLSSESGVYHIKGFVHGNHVRRSSPELLAIRKEFRELAAAMNSEK